MTENTVFEQRIIIEGAVHLILEDGVTLTAKKGIEVNEDATLDIHAQSEGADAGKLFAGTTNGSDSTMPQASEIAAIGGAPFFTNGDINIHGGIINAKAYSGAAAIGGGSDRACGTINIYGGEVSASLVHATYSASIGGGYCSKGGTVNVLGGTVTAYDQNELSVPTWSIATGATIKAGANKDEAVKVDEVGSEKYVHIEAPTHLLTSLDDGVYKQTAAMDGKYYTRFVFVRPKSELEGKSKAIFTAHYGNKAPTSETNIYYTGVTTNGVTYTPASEDSVMLVVTIKSSANISDDLTCTVAFE
ncbi:MAG: hypothetical protein IKI21_10665 [Oscillospiraceae bacterium]|nr:hypothetical protein [Oscillospiraceae bacterium]